MKSKFPFNSNFVQGYCLTPEKFNQPPSLIIRMEVPGPVPRNMEAGGRHTEAGEEDTGTDQAHTGRLYRERVYYLCPYSGKIQGLN